ncbi:Utp12 domain-containing protein [Caenorhabditis elegans]|uniref:Utp12 domain-containing protein n=1 Tax=Caenorhabditis elegans TaxID=6239 RepID=A0A0K3AV49_CAEEL|nr:Utp12 domain-containing protein [Caenorhabditis elegans]CTQ86890.1 Utp12 domain-containing protein [Caenorhabditis elegans]|eukprot:NP_001300191.1 Uncharacterized protein CELE_T10B5.3 [Caenorhabditis elegans]
MKKRIRMTMTRTIMIRMIVKWTQIVPKVADLDLRTTKIWRSDKSSVAFAFAYINSLFCCFFSVLSTDFPPVYKITE